MHYSYEPEIDGLLLDLLQRLRQVLGEKLLGLYLHGSLVMGDFDEDRSDHDLLAVTSADIDGVDANVKHA